MPSRRSVLTCKPNLPGGRFSGAFPPCRPSRDSNGSRRACLTSLSAAAGAVPGVLGFSTALTARFAGDFVFAAGLAAGFPAGLAAGCGTGLAVGAAGFAAGAAGLAGCCAGLPAPGAGFALLGVEVVACARNPGVAAAIKIPSPRVITERIVRSFPLRVSQPHRLEAWRRLPEPHPYRRAW